MARNGKEIADHGGFSGGEEWINAAEKRDIDWWITSALESNIGLNAIAQWCATFNNTLPQGLGTGMLFTDNIDMIHRDVLIIIFSSKINCCF